jgi:hypothetical protein
LPKNNLRKLSPGGEGSPFPATIHAVPLLHHLLKPKQMIEEIIVNADDLRELVREVQALKEEIKLQREGEEKLKAYSIQQTAELLNLHYTSVRKLILTKKLFAKYMHGNTGKCSVPAWAIKEYLQKKSEKR